MEVPGILRGTEFVTQRTAIAARFDMLGFNVLPQSRLVTGCPKTILTLPQVSQLAHLLGNCSLKFNIYRTVKINCYIWLFIQMIVSHALVISTFVVMPGILRWAKL